MQPACIPRLWDWYQLMDMAHRESCRYRAVKAVVGRGRCGSGRFRSLEAGTRSESNDQECAATHLLMAAFVQLATRAHSRYPSTKLATSASRMQALYQHASLFWNAKQACTFRRRACIWELQPPSQTELHVLLINEVGDHALKQSGGVTSYGM